MIVITQPSVEPVTLARVKKQLGISEDSLDDLIKTRIPVARRTIEKYTGRALIDQLREIRWDTFPMDDYLPVPSATAVTHVKYIDSAGIEQTVLSTNYNLVTYGLIPFIRPNDPFTWPSPRAEKYAVRVQFTAGYGPKASDVEPVIIEAIVEYLGHLINFQEQAESGLGIARMPFAIRDKLDMYRVRFV